MNELQIRHDRVSMRVTANCKNIVAGDNYCALKLLFLNFMWTKCCGDIFNGKNVFCCEFGEVTGELCEL